MKTSFIIQNILYTNPNSRLLFFAIGACITCKMTIKLLRNLFLFIQPSKDLAKRYGKGSWAVITGASSGNGKAFAFEFAKRGFNLVLISRNQEKLNYVSKGIQYKHPDIQTKVIAADLINAYQENFIQSIFEQIKDLDISILINNAGDYVFQPYIEIPTNKIRDLILLDTMGHALMTHAFLTRETIIPKRKKAIINISSIGAAFPRPKMQTHCASKVFLDYLSQGLASEHPDFDIISIKPSYIKTHLTEGTDPEAGAITPEEFVNATLSSLGKTQQTYGHWKHIIRGSLETFMYNLLQNIYIHHIL